MKRRVFIGLGAASIGAGALHSTGAFSSLEAGRGIAVNAVEDPGGLLGLKGNDDPQVTPEFTNNTNYVMEVTLEGNPVEFDIGEGLSDEVTFELSPKEDSEEDSTQEVTLGGDDGDVTITAVLSEDGTDATKRGEIILERFFDVPAIAAIKQVVGTFDPRGSSGKHDFTLTNEGKNDVVANGFGVDNVTEQDGENDAERVGGTRGSPDIIEADGTSVVDEDIIIGGDVEDSDPVSLPVDNTVDFSFDWFVDSDSSSVNIRDVDLVVRGQEDGATANIPLRPEDD